MSFDDSELKAEDHAYRRAAETYFEEKGKLARSSFDAKQLQTFLSFEEHWREFFAPADPERLHEYLATPFEVRKGQFERFKRECRAWEVSFQYCTRPATAGANGAAASAPTGAHWADLKRRIESHREREGAVREFYSNLDNLLDRERQRRSHPIEIVTHLRVLGVPPDASLEDVKKQFKRLAKLHHPDRHGDPVKMRSITDAYRAIMAYYKVA